MRKIIFLLLILTTWLAAQDSALVARLVALPGVAVKTVRPDSGFRQAFEIDFTQPVDHNRPYGAQFKQRIILSHLNVNRPVVLITEGYNFYSNHTRELSRLLQANEIRVEHRFFGESKPDSMDWRYLTIEQAAADHHRIVQIFKKIYPKQWINTGWSKGGQTSIFHRYFYPNDVAATVAYDAPLNLQKEEKRIDRFFGKVGTAYCRQRLKAFQRTALKRKNQLLPLFKQFAQQKHYDYSIGLEAALEYAVLEYPFSFWQYHKIECDSIPDSTASAECIFNHLKRVVALSSYNDHALNSPAMYQFFTQLGYYGYVTKGLEPYLSGAYGYSNSIFAPEAARDRYDPGPMQRINHWLQTKARRMLFIYGGRDPWSACAVNTNGNPNLVKFVLPEGNHFTFIRTFPPDRQQAILHILRRWLAGNNGQAR